MKSGVERVRSELNVNSIFLAELLNEWCQLQMAQKAVERTEMDRNGAASVEPSSELHHSCPHHSQDACRIRKTWDSEG